MRAVNLIVISTFLAACSMTNELHKTNVDLVANTATEAFRPAFHFTPPKNWMNDPNGMVYYQGEYHLFYQHNPHDTVWGPMYWGHAISKDMVNWEHQPIKLFPDEHGTIFSGSAVIDWQNTSGLGSKENPPMVAIFTYHNDEKAKEGAIDFQTQGIAYSLDKGRTWTKYEGNPVLKNPGIRDFRDPKVSWDPQTKSWIMVLAQDDHIGFYSSKNLINWQQESTFGAEWGSHAGVWECPDLIRVRVEGTNTYKYVLLVSINPGAPNGGFTKAGIRRLAEAAWRVNETTENIGARRLHTIMERLLDELSFEASDKSGDSILVDEDYVDRYLKNLVEDEDLSRYIL